MWCGRVIQLFSFQFRSDLTGEIVRCDCAYLHLLYDYTPKDDEQRALLGHDIQIMYESEPPVVYVIPVHFILGRLPVVRVGACGRIPHNMSGHSLMVQRNFNGKADEIKADGNVKPCGSPLYYVNKYAMMWSNETPVERTATELF